MDVEAIVLGLELDPEVVSTLELFGCLTFDVLRIRVAELECKLINTVFFECPSNLVQGLGNVTLLQVLLKDGGLWELSRVFTLRVEEVLLLKPGIDLRKLS